MARLLKVEKFNDGTAVIWLDIAVDKIAKISTLQSDLDTLLLSDLNQLAQLATSIEREPVAQRKAKPQ